MLQQGQLFALLHECNKTESYNTGHSVFQQKAATKVNAAEGKGARTPFLLKAHPLTYSFGASKMSIGVLVLFIHSYYIFTVRVNSNFIGLKEYN